MTVDNGQWINVGGGGGGAGTAVANSFLWGARNATVAARQQQQERRKSNWDYVGTRPQPHKNNNQHAVGVPVGGNVIIMAWQLIPSPWRVGGVRKNALPPWLQ
jgi:hypothetical protein